MAGAFEQGLLDLVAGQSADVLFVREGASSAAALLDELESRAEAVGFVTSVVQIGEDVSFSSLDEVVRGLVKNLRAPGSDKKGLVALVDTFAGRTPKKALEAFDEITTERAYEGDLVSLVRGYIASIREPRQELRALRAFLDGREADAAITMHGLSLRNAKRVLFELSHVVAACGHEGLLLIAKRGERLTDLPPVRREVAYTVLRELVDNTDSARGFVATRFMVVGSEALFEGSRSISTETPLATRVLSVGKDVAFVPHAPLLFADDTTHVSERTPEAPGPRRSHAIKALVRACQGLPPFDALAELTVGYEGVDRTIEAMFEHTSNEGSVFSLLVGDYGTGKTHLLLHATSRALDDKRPVFRLSVERLDTDLGNPQRHFRRLLENATLPIGQGTTPTARFGVWLGADASRRKLTQVLEELSSSAGESAPAAKKCVRQWADAGDDGLREILFGLDLESKPNSASYRQDAYARVLLWLELLSRMEKLGGPMFLIDEAENLYRGGTSRSERRTALRSLAFYCGGVLPHACVVLAVTPETLEALREEAAELLDEVEEQKTLLAWEDGTMLRRRLTRSRPIQVVHLTRDQLAELAGNVRAVHATVRGTTRDPQFDAWIERVVSRRLTPRELIRRVMQRLEHAFWYGRPPEA